MPFCGGFAQVARAPCHRELEEPDDGQCIVVGTVVGFDVAHQGSDHALRLGAAAPRKSLLTHYLQTVGREHVCVNEEDSCDSEVYSDTDDGYDADDACSFTSSQPIHVPSPTVSQPINVPSPRSPEAKLLQLARNQLAAQARKVAYHKDM